MNFKRADVWLKNLTESTEAGAAYCVTSEGKLLHKCCAGTVSSESKRAVSATTLFRIYSITKLFTCTAVFRLIDEGRMSLEDDVSCYLPFFDKVRYFDKDGNVSTDENKITIRALLTMTSGIPYNGSDAVPAGQLLNPVIAELDKRYGKNNYTALELSREIADSPAAFKAEESWIYGYGHDILGAVIEQITDMRLSDYLKKTVFEPLNMTDTGFEIQDKSRLMAQFNLSDKKLTRDTSADEAYGRTFLSGGGGLISTLADMAKFTAALADNKQPWSSYANRFRIPQLNIRQLAAFPFKGYSYSYGARTLLDPAGKNRFASKYEFGWYGVSGSWVAIDTERNASIVFLQQLKPNMERKTFEALRELIWSEWQ